MLSKAIVIILKRATLLLFTDRWHWKLRSLFRCGVIGNKMRAIFFVLTVKQYFLAERRRALFQASV